MGSLKEKQVFYSIFIGDEIHNVTGRKRTPAGYIALCIRTHPNSDIQGYIFEHRVVMEMKLKRYLERNEVVHHINENKQDNRIENLDLMDQVEHTVMHHKGLKRSKETRERISKWAKKRLSDKKNHPTYKDVDEELIRLYKKGLNNVQIGREIGVCRATVRNKIKYLGLKENDIND